VYWGQVQSVAPFGFFIDIGLDVNGFMPVSEVASEKIKKPLSYLSQGDWLKVSLKEVNLEKKQFSLKRVKGFSSHYAHTSQKFRSQHKKQKGSQKTKSLKKKKPSHKFLAKDQKDKFKNSFSPSKEAFNNPFSELEKIKNKF